MYTKIDKIQRNVNLADYGLIYLQNNMIWICQDYLALAVNFINLLFKISDIINFLYSLMINYKAVHKLISTKNYIKFKINWENDDIFFTNQHYQ